MQVTKTLRGRVIQAETTAQDNGWCWSYTIDGAGYTERSDPVGDEEEALREAIAHARRRIKSSERHPLRGLV
jgi:hypothetical protein